MFCSSSLKSSQKNYSFKRSRSLCGRGFKLGKGTWRLAEENLQKLAELHQITALQNKHIKCQNISNLQKLAEVNQIAAL